MLGARHMTVFCALVALERMRIVHRGVTDREAAIFVRGVDTSAVRSEFSERPAWLANKVRAEYRNGNDRRGAATFVVSLFISCSTRFVEFGR